MNSSQLLYCFALSSVLFWFTTAISLFIWYFGISFFCIFLWPKCMLLLKLFSTFAFACSICNIFASYFIFSFCSAKVYSAIDSATFISSSTAMYLTSDLEFPLDFNDFELKDLLVLDRTYLTSSLFSPASFNHLNILCLKQKIGLPCSSIQWCSIEDLH